MLIYKFAARKDVRAETTFETSRKDGVWHQIYHIVSIFGHCAIEKAIKNIKILQQESIRDGATDHVKCG